jgi:multidrug efflux pump subunit AcrA (membrane-fusion protein)
MKKVRIIIAAVLLIIVTAFFGCERIKEAYGKTKNKEASEEPAVSATVYAVNTIPAVTGQINDYLALSGDIIASSTVDTYSDAAGKVSRLYVSVGSRVRRGDPVAEVDPSRPGMEFVASVVKAPVSGIVVALPAQLGMTVSQAVPLARIAGGAGLEIRLYVAERFISKITLNQICEITLDAYPGETFRGTITEVSPTVDAASRTLEIRVGVDNTAARLKAGMFAKVRIITEQKENIVKIPAAALVNRFGEQFVFMADSSDSAAPVARKRVVTPGILIDGVLEVREGLAPEDEIVIRGQTLLDDGSRINIVERLAPLSAN